MRFFLVIVLLTISFQHLEARRSIGQYFGTLKEQVTKKTTSVLVTGALAGLSICGLTSCGDTVREEDYTKLQDANIGLQEENQKYHHQNENNQRIIYELSGRYPNHGLYSDHFRKFHDYKENIIYSGGVKLHGHYGSIFEHHGIRLSWGLHLYDLEKYLSNKGNLTSFDYDKVIVLYADNGNYNYGVAVKEDNTPPNSVVVKSPKPNLLSTVIDVKQIVAVAYTHHPSVDNPFWIKPSLVANTLSDFKFNDKYHYRGWQWYQFSNGMRVIKLDAKADFEDYKVIELESQPFVVIY